MSILGKCLRPTNVHLHRRLILSWLRLFLRVRLGLHASVIINLRLKVKIHKLCVFLVIL